MAKKSGLECQFCGNKLAQPEFEKVYTCNVCGCGYSLVEAKNLRDAMAKAAADGNEISFIEIRGGFLVFLRRQK